MTVELSAPVEVPSWEAQILRVSLFLPSNVEATTEMWTAMMGSPPESEQRRPRDITAVKFTGAIEGATVVLASSPLRMDVFVQAGQPAPGTLPTIMAGDATRLNKLLAERVPALLGCLPKLTRLAFGGTLFHQVGAPEEAMKLLKAMLKSVSVDERMHDLLYRVNWVAKMQNGLSINRLTTWTSLSLKFAAVMAADSPDAVLAVNHYLQLEFDNNTVPDPPISFEPKEAEEAFAFCLQLASENMAKGEVIPA
jgi:hypothetical protein